MKEKNTAGETIGFVYDKSSEEWTATFTEMELRAFVSRIQSRAKTLKICWCGNEIHKVKCSRCGYSWNLHRHKGRPRSVGRPKARR